MSIGLSSSFPIYAAMHWFEITGARLNERREVCFNGSLNLSLQMDKFSICSSTFPPASCDVICVIRIVKSCQYGTTDK